MSQLEALRADSLHGLQHGFFTRRGGVSGGMYDGLNCGVGSADDAALVTENRRRAMAHLGADPSALYSVHQVHSQDAVVVADSPWDTRPKADAMVTDRPGAVLGILTADCAPVLFADAHARVIGAAHAGWKGALGGVLEATLDAMETLGADRTNVQAAIGPLISPRAYEVGPEFMDRFLDDDPDNDRFFAGGSGDRVHFDLPGYGLSRLRAAGIGTAEWTGHCTFADPGRFYSYRRTTHAGESDYGRLLSAIRL